MERTCIRLAGDEDFHPILHILNQAIKGGKSNAYLQPFTHSEGKEWFEENKSFIIVWCIQEDVVGYATITPYRKGRAALSKVAELSYYLHNDYQKKGWGSHFLPFTIDYAQQTGWEHLIAILLSVNTGSIRLLQKNKFARWGEMPGIVTMPTGNCDHLYYGLHLTKTATP